MTSAVSSEFVGKVVCPGDKVLQLPETGVVRVGRGLEQDGDSIVAHKAGVLKQMPNGKLWIHGRQKRYIPQVNDAIIGIITRRSGETYEVDINAPSTALLNLLAFEGATRRNRPQLLEGDLVYARVETADRDIQPTLICMDAIGKASGYGPLKEGTIFPVSTAHSRTLMSSPCPSFLPTLGKRFEFEMVVGGNGRVWVKGKSATDTVAVQLAIQQAEGRTEMQQIAVVNALAKSIGLS